MKTEKFCKQHLIVTFFIENKLFVTVCINDNNHMEILIIWEETINLVNDFNVDNVVFNCGEYNSLEKNLIMVKGTIQFHLQKVTIQIH